MAQEPEKPKSPDGYGPYLLQSKAQLLEQKLDIRTRRYKFTRYPNCFIGQDAVPIIIHLKLASNETEAIEFGNQLITGKLIEHVTNEHDFKKDYLFYQFTDHYHNSKIEPQQNETDSSTKDDSFTVTYIVFLISSNYQCSKLHTFPNTLHAC